MELVSLGLSKQFLTLSGTRYFADMRQGLGELHSLRHVDRVP